MGANRRTFPKTTVAAGGELGREREVLDLWRAFRREG